MINIPSYNEDPSYRYKMPRLVTKIEGRGNGIKTNIVNMAAVSSAIKTPPSYATKFFGCELGAQSRWEDSTEKSIVNGAHDQQEMQKLLDKFLDKYVLCYKCKLPELDMAVTKGLIHAKCAACGWSGNLDNAHKVSTFIVGHPPDGSLTQNAAGGKSKSKDERRREKTDAPEVVVVGGGFTSDEDEVVAKGTISRSSSTEEKSEKKEKKEKSGNDEKNTDSFSEDYPE